MGARGVSDAPQRRSLRRRVRFLAIATGVILALAYIAGSVLLVVTTTTAPKGHTPAAAADAVGQTHEDVSFSTRNGGLTLRGWLFHARRNATRAVVFVSGWKADRRVFTPIAHDMVAHGYDALLFDPRASGESDGDHQTLGNLERRDVLGAYDFMRARGYQARNLIVFGTSMGGAATIEALPEMRDVGAIIVDSSFAELGPVIAAQWTAATSLPGGFDILGITLGRIVGLDPGLRPVDVVAAHPERAFLFFHAEGDGLVPVSQAHELVSASRNPRSVLFVTSGPAHQATYTVGPQVYMERVYSFVDAELGAHG